MPCMCLLSRFPKNTAVRKHAGRSHTNDGELPSPRRGRQIDQQIECHTVLVDTKQLETVEAVVKIYHLSVLVVVDRVVVSFGVFFEGYGSMFLAKHKV